MKKLITILLSVFLCCGFSLFGQELTLEDVCLKLAENQNTVGEFTQIKTIQSNGRQLKSTGKFVICTKGIVWDTLKPFKSSVIFTADKMVQVSNSGKVSVMDGKDNLMFENISSTMIAVFAGDTDLLKTNFTVKFIDNGNGNWVIDLVPNDDTIRAVMDKLILVGSSSGKDISLDSLEMTESSGNTIKYIFSNQSYPKELSVDEEKYFSLK